MKNSNFDHKFRFQLLEKWISLHYKAGTAADVGGSKGLLALLLNKNGWNCTVIDPFKPQSLTKYKDLETGKRVLISRAEAEAIPRRIRHFVPEMTQDYDLLIGLHAHGVNMKIIEACKKYNKKFVLLPCCVIDEPIVPQAGIHWFNSLVLYAKELGLPVETAELKFKGQNKILFLR